MTAYLIGEIDVIDAAAYRAYPPLTTALLARYGGRFVVRGGKTRSLEAEPPRRVIIIAFATLAAAEAFWDSPDYQAARAIRLRSAASRFFIVEGVPEGE